VRRVPAILLAALLLLPGCIGDDEESGPITLKVGADVTEGHVEVVKGQNDQVISSSEVEVTFDFTDTFSGDGAVQTYWLQPGDGGAFQEVNAAETNTITHEYPAHGAFQATAGANDSAGNSASKAIRITIHLVLFLNESSATGTDDPSDVTWDTSSEHSIAAPLKTSIESRVVNLENLFFIESETVEVTWTAVDPNDETAGTQTASITEGDEYTWSFEQSTPELGPWVLHIDLDTQDEQVQVYTKIHVMYPTS